MTKKFSPVPTSRRRFLDLSLKLGISGAACGLAADLAGLGSGNARAEEKTTKTLRVGIMSGEDEELWAVVTKNAAQNGLNLKIIVFSDYNQPNEALNVHDLDANAFQHQPFLDAQKKAHGYTISAIGNTFFQPISFFSRKYKNVADLPKGGKIGIPNDPSNEGRALHLLESLGLIKVSTEAGLFPTALDIVENPHDFTLSELDGGIVGRSLADLDAAIVNSDWAMRAGIDINKERIGTESLKNNPYVNFIAVNDTDLHASWGGLLVHSFQQPNIKEAIARLYHGTVTPAW